MKTFALSITFLLLGFCTYSQTQKVTIYCELTRELAGLRIDYGDLDRLLPDSIKKSVLIDSINSYNLLDGDVVHILLLMGTAGWKVSCSMETRDTYVLSKEIFLDGPALKLYIEKIKGSFRKPVHQRSPAR